MRRTACAVAGMLIAGLLFPAIATGDSSVPASSIATQAALDFRDQFGLETSPAFLAAVAADPTSSMKYGVPLTASEQADIDRREAIVDGLDPMSTALQQAPEYAGMWVDQRSGGEIVVEVAGDPGTVAAVVKSTLPRGASYRLAPAEFTLAQLESVRQDIAAVEDSLAKSAGLTGVGIDVATNRVLLGFDPYTTNSEAAMRSRFGPAISAGYLPRAIVSAEECVDRDDCPGPAYKGGIHVFQTATGTECTSGFGSRIASGGVTNKWYLMTAGHCVSHGGGSGVNWAHFGYSVGLSGAFQYCDHCTADVSVISISSWDTPTNLVYRQSASDLVSITARRSNANQLQGTVACRSVWRSNNYVCGTIALTFYDHLIWDGKLQQNLWQNDNWLIRISVQPGDSGGSVLSGGTALGIVGSGGANETWYSTVDFINSAIGYRPCITATQNPCG